MLPSLFDDFLSLLRHSQFIHILHPNGQQYLFVLIQSLCLPIIWFFSSKLLLQLSLDALLNIIIHTFLPPLCRPLSKLQAPLNQDCRVILPYVWIAAFYVLLQIKLWRLFLQHQILFQHHVLPFFPRQSLLQVSLWVLVFVWEYSTLEVWVNLNSSPKFL